jgi:hypothetical protein
MATTISGATAAPVRSGCLAHELGELLPRLLDGPLEAGRMRTRGLEHEPTPAHDVDPAE